MPLPTGTIAAIAAFGAKDCGLLCGYDAHRLAPRRASPGCAANKVGGAKRATCLRPVYSWFAEGFDAPI